MSEKYVITGPDVDLTEEVILDSKGRRVDQEYVDRALAEVEEHVTAKRGRPSLSGDSASSPQVTFRVAADVKQSAEAIAKARGTTVSVLAREALEAYIIAIEVQLGGRKVAAKVTPIKPAKLAGFKPDKRVLKAVSDKAPRRSAAGKKLVDRPAAKSTAKPATVKKAAPRRSAPKK
jgi:hypothetical protein